MVTAPCADHLRFAPTHDSAFEIQAENCIAFAEARRMAYPVVRPADGQGNEKDLAATDLQAGHAHGSGHPSRVLEGCGLRSPHGCWTPLPASAAAIIR